MKFSQELAWSHTFPQCHSSLLVFRFWDYPVPFLENLFLNIILTHKTEHISLAIRATFLIKTFLSKAPLCYASHPFFVRSWESLVRGSTVIPPSRERNWWESTMWFFKPVSWKSRVFVSHAINIKVKVHQLVFEALLILSAIHSLKSIFQLWHWLYEAVAIVWEPSGSYNHKAVNTHVTLTDPQSSLRKTF